MRGILENEFGFPERERRDLLNIAEEYQVDDGNFWVTVDGGKVVGTIGLRDCGEGIGYLERFYVDEKFRGKEKGVSQSLFLTLLGFAKSKLYKKIYLQTHKTMERAHKFYEKNGFKEVKDVPDDFSDSAKEEDVIYELYL